MSNEYYASEDSNLEEGQTNEDVGQKDEGETQGKSSSEEWKNQAKYFQSEKDKLYAENQKLSKLAQVGNYIQANPELAQKLADHVNGDDTPDVQLERDEFDPWEAYNDPASKSFQLREQQEERKINKRVNEAVGSALGSVKRDVAYDKLTVALKERGLNNEQVQSFMEFAQENPANYGVDGAIKMWQSVTGNDKTDNPLDKIRQNQQNPASAGVLQGQQPKSSDETDDMWKGIMGASPAIGKDGKLP